MVPGLDWAWFGAIVAAGGIFRAGLLRDGHLGFRQHEGTVRSDFFWYALFPLLAYVVFAGQGGRASPLGGQHRSAGDFGRVSAVAGIRNAWDMIVFFVTKADGAG
jgi:hypothetical protein